MWLDWSRLKFAEARLATTSNEIGSLSFHEGTDL